MISLEVKPDRAARARANFERAGVADRVSVIVGDAARYLHKVAGPFDLVFQDGAKSLYEPLLERLVGLLRPRRAPRQRQRALERAGRRGGEGGDDPDAIALRAYNRRLAGDARLLTTFVPVGDGLAVSVKLGER